MFNAFFKRRIHRSNEPRRDGRRLSLEPLETRTLLAVTPQLIDLNSTAGSSPSDFTTVGDTTYFVAEDTTNGRELWTTDGTSAGTSMLKNIRSGADSSDPTELVNFDGKLFFVADDGTNGQELWMSDGTATGTVMVKDINPGLQSSPRHLTVVDGVLFFSAEDATNGIELWKSDGTASGTVLVKDIFSGTHTDNSTTDPNDSAPEGLIDVDGTLFFTAYDDTAGRELWKSDGTAAGTVMVKDIRPGSYPYYYQGTYQGEYPSESRPGLMTVFDGKLFFVAQDDTHGAELWKTDGTYTGTVLVEDINPGTADAFTEDSPMMVVDGELFFAANDGTHGDELWKSDGTAAGTVLVKDIEPGSDGDLSKYGGFTDFDGTLFFAADDGSNGKELWKSDGTATGTVMVKDIDTGSDGNTPNDSYPFHMEDVNGTLYFSAFTATHGRELWKSDGTAAGTVLVADSVSGDSGLSPHSFTTLDGALVFSGDDGSGRELWSLEIDPVEPEETARLTIFVDGQRVVIPAELGVNSDDSTADIYTNSNDGGIFFDPTGSPTLGDFFDIWRTDAGLAGNNPDAVFSADELLGNDVGNGATVQMFVNGELSNDFDQYAIQEGDEIVLVFGDNPVVALNTNFGSIVIELFEDETPITVENFLNYVNDGDYVGTFFHRSDPNFVIQGGGFTTTSTTYTSKAQFSAIATDAAIANESGISNLQATVSMARTTAVNSATSQFFINLTDNTGLDASSSTAHDGYAVFGQVLDMTTVDEIEGLPINTTNGSPYGELPVSTSNQLAVIQAVEGQGEVTGIKFFDENANGALDSGESGVAGVSVYIDVNDNGVLDAGDVSTTTDADGRFFLQIEQGTYTLRADISTDRVPTLPAQSDTRSVTVEVGRETTDIDFGEAALWAPSDIDLLSAADSGIPTDDDITNYNNQSSTAALHFQVDDIMSGAEVRIYSDGVQIGSATSATDGTILINTDGLTTLSDGTHQITARQVTGGVTSEASTALTVTIDTTPPGAIASTAPEYAQVGHDYEFNADSPSEGLAGITYSLSGQPSGMTIDKDTGLIEWTPTLAQAVPQEFEIRVSDTAGNSASQAVDMTVLGVIPAYPDEYTVLEDSLLSVVESQGVLDNDGDQDSGVLTAVVVTQPANGTLSFDADGSFQYTPDADFFGTDTFTYKASDQNDDSNVAKVTINVTGVNDPPAPVDDQYTLAEDGVLTTNANNGVLKNDVEVDGDTLTATIVSHPTDGSVNLASDGTFTYTPDANFSGTDSFTYTASDGTEVSDPVTVTLTITEVADPPTGVADSYSVDEDNTLSITATLGVLDNDTDPDSTSFTASLHTQAQHGTVTLDSDGSFDYTPDADYYGTDTFTYVASDGTNSSAATTVTITVNNLADPPSAVDDSFTAPNDGTAQTFDVTSNDTFEPDPSETLTIKTVTQGTNGGTVTISSGEISYKAPAGFIGSDTFTYTIEDSDGLTDQATVTVSVQDASDNQLSGFVYIDHDNDGAKDAGETGVPGVRITLTGTDTADNSVTRTVLTRSDGSYLFEELPAGTYKLTETQPAALVDGLDLTSASGVTAANNSFSNIVLGNGQTTGGINFGERCLRPQFVSVGLFLASTPPVEEYLTELVARAEELAGRAELAAAIRARVQLTPTAAADAYDASKNQTLNVDATEGLLVNDTDALGDPINLPDGVVITEINYSPAEPSAAELQVDSTFTSDDFEFIEIKNVGDESVDLAGVEFTGGITFDFTGSAVEELAPGETALVVADLAAFEARYGTDLNVAGEFSGTLNDAGEQLSLLDTLSNPIHQFSYGIDSGWPTIVTDGGTIEVVDVGGDYADPANWTASSDSEGTPGTADPIVAVDFLMAELVEDPLHGLLTLNANGSFSYTPDDGFSGTDSFRYKLTDGENDESNKATVTIDVKP